MLRRTSDRFSLASRAVRRTGTHALASIARVAIADIKQRLFDQGTEPVASSQQQFQTYVKTEIDKYAEIIRKSGAKVD
ncbi:MAG: hypothetical protein ACXWCY_10065 [Burkholderiales bacterium]